MSQIELSTAIMEKAVSRRDPAYDGAFFVAVRTTSVFCRPSCPARTALRKNRVFYRTAKEAIFAGYRPCKRCRPLATNGRPPDWVEMLLKKVEADPESRIRDADLRRLGVDPARARRHFRRQYGMTFQAYCRGRRLGTALQRIREGLPLDDVILGHGYESHSGFRDAFKRTHGKAPGNARTAECVWTKLLESPLGPLVIGATPEGACLLEFSDRRMLEAQFETLRQRFRCAIVPGENEHLAALERELAAYFAGTLQEFRVPLVYPGTPFQERVWSALRRIPYGETRSYEELGRSIDLQSGWRAVGHANGQNRLAIVIPCHRVIQKGGALGGYGGGLWRKEWLLAHERSHRAGASERSRDSSPRSTLSPGVQG
jgi:AraC family transcriptional regulator, regulatory protein of adaptative response / methylated-DNA-[protein]-cysteine methyltransferase